MLCNFVVRRAFELLALTGAATAWNTDVHNQIGFMAETFLTENTKAVISKILEPQYEGSIGKAAAWADSYAHTTEGAFSYQWHWIDSSDDPPAYCNVHYNRDCTEGGCIVSAIANQTEILRHCIAAAKCGNSSNTTATVLQCSYALKWITHFLGDITQPLHASGIAVGGNSFPVTFAGKKTELHAVWDGSIIYYDANVTGFSNTSLDPFFAGLVARISADSFFETTASWLSCVDPSTPLGCALDWARDTNGWTCDYVYSQVFNDTDLATSGYADGGVPIVEIQTAKAALRLGTYLNKLVDGDYKMDREVILRTNPSWALGPNEGA
ncbi:Nuclease PA3 [Pleurostoma richardsiae]|uniref:Nuclease PA3 n=1 Tax=Pleurostoma richardsiae TaxID=41990 RepID=A0AA38RSA8_9PEZI|nr:Nuclease PA3 [Pleurostoma richardsiae]